MIELVVVIAILGILVALAIPKYVDLSAKAKKASDDGYVAALRSSTLMLYGSNLAANATNSFGTYWPGSTNVVISNMADAYALKYYTAVNYNPTTGVWTTTP